MKWGEARKMDPLISDTCDWGMTHLESYSKAGPLHRASGRVKLEHLMHSDAEYCSAVDLSAALQFSGREAVFDALLASALYFILIVSVNINDRFSTPWNISASSG